MKSPENSIPSNVESNESIERGRDVLVSIDLIRHPEKDPATGKLTQVGKNRFFEQLSEDFAGKDEYDTVKFYVSPLSRGQEAKEPISAFLEAAEINTKIRNKEELIGRFNEVGPGLKEAVTTLLEQNESLTRQQIEETRLKDKSILAYEPASKDFETKTNELLIRDFFDKNFPSTQFTGRDHADVLKGLIDHFSELASRLKSGSKVKLVLVGHSGVIEYLTKLVYLQNHPELKSEDVDVDKIGGLVGFGEGPEITIKSDENGEQKIEFKFKVLDLVYKTSS